MSNETVLAGTSPVESADPFAGHEPTLAEYASYRQSGELPERFKPADNAVPAPAQDSSEGDQPESASESETDHQQEQPKPQAKKLDAKGRIAQIDTQIESLWSQEEPDVIKIAQLEATKDKIEQRAGLKRKTEVAPVTPQQAQQPQQVQYTRPKPGTEDKNSDGTPKYGTYEEYVEELADWKAEQRIVQREREYAEQRQAQFIRETVDKAKETYGGDFDLIDAAAGALRNDRELPDLVMKRVLRSDHVADLLHALVQEPGGIEKFIATAKADMFHALDHLAMADKAISDKLSTPKPTPERNEKGQFAAAEEPPAPKKTSAPKPPSPVGGGSSRSFDVNDESLSPDEWMRKRNTQKRS